MRVLRLSVLVFVLAASSGCSLKSVALLETTRPLLTASLDAVMAESDSTLARNAMETDLKLLDGMLRLSPADDELLTLSCQGYTGYSLLFVEDEDVARGRMLYARARDNGLRALSNLDDRISSSGTINDYENALKNISLDEVPAAYWTATAWAGWASLSRDDPAAAAGFLRARLLMERVQELDSAYFSYGPLWFMGAYYSALPPLLGGNLKRAANYFERADSLSRGKFLWGKLLYLKSIPVSTFDQGLFDRLIQEIESGTIEAPGIQLLNAVAKSKARIIKSQADVLFQ